MNLKQAEQDKERAEQEEKKVYQEFIKLLESQEVKDLYKIEKEVKNKIDLILNPLRAKLNESQKLKLKYTRLYNLAKSREDKK